MALKGNFSQLSLNDKNNPNFTILIQNASPVQKLTQNDFEHFLSFLQEFFLGGNIYCYANFFRYANFSLAYKPNFRGERGNCLWHPHL